MTEKDSEILQERSITTPILLLLAASLLFVGPLLNGHWIMVGESIDQITRLIELDRGIRGGSYYPRWLGDLAGGFGYPYFVFYAPLIYYVSEAFHLLGFGFLTSLKLMIFLGVVLSGIGMFMLAKCFWGTHGAVVCAAAYIYIPYRMVNIYIRGDFAEAFAMALFPWVLYFFSMAQRRRGRLYMVGAAGSYAALIFTHNCSALIFSPFLLCFIGFVSLQIRSWKSLSIGLGLVVWALGLSAFFWVPALLEKRWVNIHLIYSTPAVDFHNNFLEISRVLDTGWRLEGGIAGRELPFQIGLPHIILALFSIVYLIREKQNQEFRQFCGYFLLCALLALFLTNSSSVLLWEKLPFFKFLQFPWRFLSVLALFLSLASGALFISFAVSSGPVQKSLALVLLVIVILSGIQFCKVRGYYVIQEKNLTPAFVTGGGGTASAYNTKTMEKIQDYGEYLPKSVKKLPSKNLAGQVLAVSGKVAIRDVRRYLDRYEFNVFAEQKAEILVGSFYYPSWSVHTEDMPLAPFTDQEGLIHFKVSPGDHRIRVFFGESKERRFAGYVSLLALLIILPFILLKGKRGLVARGTS